MADNTMWAYIAGLMDGEGCIRIEGIRKNHRGSQLQISLGNTNKEVIDWLYRKIGGSITIYKRGCIGFLKKPAFYVWRTCAKNAQYFLENIETYSIIKRQEILLALEFCRTFNDKHNPYQLHPEIQKYRNLLMNIIKSLKRGEVLSQII